jgi:SRSO17 transposase
MDLPAAKASEARFEAYIANLARLMGHEDREEPLQDYSRGLFMAPGRKSVEPLTACVYCGTPRWRYASRQDWCEKCGRFPPREAKLA